MCVVLRMEPRAWCLLASTLPPELRLLKRVSGSVQVSLTNTTRLLQTMVCQPVCCWSLPQIASLLRVTQRGPNMTAEGWPSPSTLLPSAPSTVHLMFHVTSEQIGGCPLQVGTRCGKSPGIHPAPTITTHIVLQGTHEERDSHWVV